MTALATMATAIVAAYAAFQSRSSARKADAAARTLATIERDRRHAELCPRLRVSCESFGSSTDNLMLRVMLFGPTGLDHLDALTVMIRDDHFKRGEGPLMAGGPTREQIKQQIWGPYRFTPGTGPDEAKADSTGRSTTYQAVLPVGEELPFQLERTTPPSWTHMSHDDWQRDRGTVIRLGFVATHVEHSSWTLPCEIDVGGASKQVTLTIPQL